MSGYLTFGKYYDVLTQNVDYNKLAEYYYSLLCQHNVKEGILLDLACGTGTLCELLYDKGYEIIGVDNSNDMLNIATKKREVSNKDILYLYQNMDKLDLFGTIEACICTFDSINHIIDEEVVQTVFDKVSLFMVKDGIFIFDVNTCYKHQNILSGKTYVYDYDDVYCVWHNSRCYDQTMIDITLDIFANEEYDSFFRYQEEFSERAYTQQEMSDFIKNAGFEVLQQYDDFTTNEVTPKSQRITYVLRKL